MRIQVPANGWRPRPYQMPLWAYLERGGTHAVAVWHRRSGKDEVALHRSCVAAHERVGNYWHMLPAYNHARKAIWDAINPHSGKKRIDEAFPRELCSSRNETEMKIELKSGSTWQLVGSDNFDALIGSPPVGIVYSEWAVANPRAHGYLRPILAENNGWSLFIYTSRGYNHGFTTYESARGDPQSYAQILTVEDTQALSPEIVERERKAYLEEYGENDGDALFRQEYYCDFSASNIGAILGRYIETAERSGRISDDVEDDGTPVWISSDIGYRDTASWWVWQPKHAGFSLVDYDEDTGLDADDWIERLKKLPYVIGSIWLPQDAKVKTFQSKHSAVERFIKAFGAERIKVVPPTKIPDRINAARTVLKTCEFHKTRCKAGLLGLRNWSYKYDEERKTFSREPDHNWASHPGDGFSYGAVVLRHKVKEEKVDDTIRPLQPTLNDMWEFRERQMMNERRI